MAATLGYVGYKSLQQAITPGRGGGNMNMLTLIRLYKLYYLVTKENEMLKATSKTPMNQLKSIVGGVEDKILGLDAIVTELQVSLRELRAGLGISSKR